MANTLKFGDGKWATGEGTALAFNDENDNFKPLPFTFTRNSSATVVNESGLIEEVGNDVPRIDFKDNTKGALLLEPQRTNIFQQSNTFDQWSDTTIVLTSGQNGFAGSNDAWLMEKNGGNSRIFIAVTTSGVTTTSVYAKANASNYLRIRCDTTNATSNTYFDLSNGTIHNTLYTIDEKIEDVGGGWYRCSVVPRDPTTIVRLYPAEAGGTSNVSGSIYIQYAQLEQGSYATSYIKTEGSAVTRVADSCIQTVPDGVIGQTEGTIFLDFIRKPQSNNTTGLFGISSSNNERVIIWNNFSLNGLGLQIRANGVSIFGNQSLGTFDNDENYKIAISYKSGEIKAYVNGSSILNFTNSFTFSNDINTIVVNSYQVGVNCELSPFKDLKLYNTALTDSELATLTQV